ncbi:MAG: 16S rRNA (guanine(966)-N(2))-methyltransferase RsmD [Anaerolineales bacterium]
MAGLRVIAGEAKGRKLRMVSGAGTRPITDRVKESLFSILAGDVPGSQFLDLFAGTGSVGIEALSRGAARATFVESGARALTTLQANLELTRLADRGRVVRADVFRFLAGRPDTPFDIVYVAPPQYADLWLRTIQLVDSNPGWLTEGGVLIAQMHPKEWTRPTLQRLRVEDDRSYGSTRLIFFGVGSAEQAV